MDEFSLTPSKDSPHIDEGKTLDEDREASVQVKVTAQVSVATADALEQVPDERVSKVIEAALRDVATQSPDEKEVMEAREDLKQWIKGNRRGK